MLYSQWERLNDEISELTCKLSQLQETIIQLEKEKGEMQTKHEMEKSKFESETSHLQGLISELHQTLSVLRGEREALEQTSREQQAIMTAEISAMNVEITCLSEMIHHKELAATALGQQVAEEQKQRGILKEKMEKQDQMNEVTIQALSQQVGHLETTLKSKEEEGSRLQAVLQEKSESAIQERDTILVEYHQFRQEKEEQVVNLNEQARQLEEQREVQLSILSDFRREKEELHLKLMSLESALRDLKNELEVESRKHKETLAAKLRKHSQMESEIIELGNRVQQLLTDIELMSQQLNESQQQKLHAESGVEQLKIECRELSNTLSAERDLLVKEHAAEVEMLNAKVRIQTEEVEKLLKETEQNLVNLEAMRAAKRNVESSLNSVIEKHQAEICTLHLELTNVQELVKQKEAENKLLLNEISMKAEELTVQHEHVLYLQSETNQMEELQQHLAEKEKSYEMAKQDAVVGNEESRLLRITLDEKENQIAALLQSIQALEGKTCDLQDLQNKKIEDYKHSVSELEHRLAEGQAQIKEKAAAFESQGQHVLSLQKDLALEQARAFSLEDNLKASEALLQNQKMQEQELRREAVVHSEELKNQKSELEKLQREILLTQEEKQEAERRAVVATEQIAMLQVEVLSVSSLATERNTSLEHVKKEILAVRTELNGQKAQDIERCKLADSNCKRQEEAIEELHRDVLSVSSLASERQQKIQVLQTEVSSLKMELDMQQEVVHLRDQETGSKCMELEKEIAKLKAQFLEASSLVSIKESDLCSLRSKAKEMDNLRLQAVETQEAQRKELEEKVAQLQVELLEASSIASIRESDLSSLRSKEKEVDILRLQAVETQEAQRKELEEKVAQLQAELLEASSIASIRESDLSSLRSKEKEMDNLRLQAVETQEAQRKELEEKVAQLQVELLEASSIASIRESDLSSLRSKEKEVDILRLQAVETQEAQRKELEEKVAQLQAELLEASSIASIRESDLSSLRSKEKEMDNLRLQAVETQEAQRKELVEKVAHLQDELLEASSIASIRESDLSSLRSKEKEVDILRLQAVETQEAQHKELEAKVAQLQVELLEASSIASRRESDLSSLRSKEKEMDNLRLQAVETQEAQRKELEEKVAQLQVELLEASSIASIRESDLSSLRSKEKEVDILRLQAVETQEAQHKELEEKVAQLQAQVLKASSLTSVRELEISSMQREMKGKDSLRLQVIETQKAQLQEFEQKIRTLHEELQHASSLVIQKQQVNEALTEELKERDVCQEKNLLQRHAEKLNRKVMEETIANLKAELVGASSQEEHAAKLQQKMAALKHTNEELLSIREELQKEQAASHKSTADLAAQLQLARDELSELRPLREVMADRSQLNNDLQKQLSLKSEALEHYKSQVCTPSLVCLNYKVVWTCILQVNAL